MKRLIITADDFGGAVEVNEAVERGFREGVLRAASLMVAAPACADAVARARRMTGLGVGLHIVLVEGQALLAPSSLPDLVDANGAFRTDMARMGAEIAFRPKVMRQVKAEIVAQFEAFRATGLRLDHVNAHKHYHLHPVIAWLILDIGRDFGLRASRAPIEPHAVLSALEPATRPGSAWLTDPWAKRLRRRYRRAGVAMADQVFGLAWSGAMTAARTAGIVRRLPPGLSEIYLHPATRGGFAGAAPGYRYADELEALVSIDVAEAVRASGAQLGTFSDFA